MNEQIREILSQCQLESIDGPEYPRWTDLEKFAELIVRECAEVADNADATREKWEGIGKYVREHFGVKE